MVKMRAAGDGVVGRDHGGNDAKRYQVMLISEVWIYKFTPSERSCLNPLSQVENVISSQIGRAALYV